jgi:peroxiredoxin
MGSQELKFFDIKGKLIDLTKQEKKAVLILFFDPSNSYQKGVLVYAQVLHKKYKNRGLWILGIANKEKEKINTFYKKGYFTFPLIFDNNDIHNQFNICNDCAATILLDQENNIKFKTPRILISKENLRQIVEKEILGKISYDFKPVEHSFFILNQKAENISLEDTKSKNVMHFIDFREKYLIATFFSSVCSSCASGRRINTLVNLENDLKKKLRKEDYRILLIFMNPFDINDIKEWEKSVFMPFGKYISEDIFSDEEKYITNDAKKRDPLTIILNEQRNVVFLEGLENEENIIMKNIKKTILNLKNEKK